MEYKVGSYYRVFLPKEIPYCPCYPNIKAEKKHLTLELKNEEIVKVTRSNFEIVENSFSLVVENSEGCEVIVSVSVADSFFIPIFMKKRKR